MTDLTTNTPDVLEMRELSMDELDDVSGAGIISWLKRLFGGDNPQPPRGPHNKPADHLK